MRLYLQLLRAGIRARLQYRWDFLFTTVLYAGLVAIDFLTVAAILYRYPSVAGWNLHEVALLSGTVSCSVGLFRTFAGELEGFERYLVTGEFDQILTRPWPALAGLLARNFDLGRLGALLQGGLVLAIGLRGVMARGAPPWLPAYVLLLPLAGACVQLALGLGTAAAGFWIIRIEELQVFARNAPSTAANYPAEIYPRWLRYLLTGFLPVLAVGQVPLRYALDKGGTALALAAPLLAAAVSLAVGLRLWGWGIRHYQSTGS